MDANNFRANITDVASQGSIQMWWLLASSNDPLVFLLAGRPYFPIIYIDWCESSIETPSPSERVKKNLLGLSHTLV